MANDCLFEMKITGEKENVETLVRWLKADYDVKEPDYFFSRIFEAYETNVEEGESGYSSYVSGDCAWSVYSCMFSGVCTYYSDDNDLEHSRRTCMENATKELSLKVEIYSCETGLCFAEHYIVDNGKILVDEEVEYCEYCIEEFATKEEAEEELDLTITDKEWEYAVEENYFTRGGFDMTDPWHI